MNMYSDCITTVHRLLFLRVSANIIINFENELESKILIFKFYITDLGKWKLFKMIFKFTLFVCDHQIFEMFGEDQNLRFCIYYHMGHLI